MNAMVATIMSQPPHAAFVPDIVMRTGCHYYLPVVTIGPVHRRSIVAETARSNPRRSPSSPNRTLFPAQFPNLASAAKLPSSSSTFIRQIAPGSMCVTHTAWNSPVFRLLVAACGARPTGNRWPSSMERKFPWAELNADSQPPAYRIPQRRWSCLASAARRRRLMAQNASEQGVDKTPEYVTRQRRLNEDLLIGLAAKASNRRSRVHQTRALYRCVHRSQSRNVSATPHAVARSAVRRAERPEQIES
jgi:hypothetical protein